MFSQQMRLGSNSELSRDNISRIIE